jgi:hypothetical protein
VDALVNFTGGGVGFRATITTTATTNSGNNLIYNNEIYDTEEHYDTATGVYEIVIGGTYLFTLGVQSVGVAFVVNLIRKRGLGTAVVQQITNGADTGTATYYLTALIEVQTGDEIYGYVNSGSVSIVAGQLSFSGSRISN